MAFKKETDTTLVISKPHKAMLKAIAKKHQRSLRQTTQLMIEEKLRVEGIESFNVELASGYMYSIRSSE